MARYTIDFSTNASAVVREIEKVNKAIAQVASNGKSIKITLDAAPLRTSFDTTFRELDKQIDRMQRRLSQLKIGSRAFQEQATGLGVTQGIRERGGMQARAIQLGAQAGAFDAGSFAQLQRQIEAARIEASQLTPNTEPWVNLQRQIGQLNTQLQASGRLAENVQLTESLGAFAPSSLNAIEAKLRILRNRAREIAPDTKEWKELNKEIAKAERGIAKQTRRPLSRGQRFGAAGGAFLYGGGLGGGIGSAVGGVAGGLLGGVPGAFTGAAIGQLADNLASVASSVTKSAASIAQLQRGLALASIDASDFAEAQRAIKDSSDRLVVPLEQVYRQFTQLRVNTKQYGLSVKDTQEILEGTSLAVSSVGGSLDDVDGALRAVVQIFSKGSVQAEELRGQLGERFPGAVVKFAQANKLSFEELQDGLQKGEIGIKEFVEFAKKNYEDYGKFAERLATGPEFAGRRLEKALGDLQIAIGSALGPAGAIFQDFFTETINGFAGWVNDNKQFITEYLRDWAIFVTDFARVVGGIIKVVVNVSKTIIDIFRNTFREVRRLLGMISAAEIQRDLADVNAKIEAAGGEAALKSTQRGARMNSLLLRRSQLQMQFKAAGGEAAIERDTPRDDFTYGGPGAGMSLTRTGGGGAGKTKQQKERESQVPQLKLQLELAQKLFEIDKQIAEARIENNLTLSSELELVRRLTELQFEAKKILLETIPEEEKRLKLEELQYQRQQEILGSQLKLQLDLNQQYREIKGNIDGIVDSQKEETDYVKQYLDLVMSGVKPAIAEVRIEVAKRFAEEKKTLDLQIEQKKNSISQLEATISLLTLKESLTDTEKLRLDYARATLANLQKELALRQGLKDALPGQQAATEQAVLEAAAPKPFGVEIAEGASEVEEELKNIVKGSNLVITSANNIGDAFGQVFSDIITGAQNWQEAFSNAIKSVASSFADLAAQILAKSVALKIIGLFLPGGPGPSNVDFELPNSAFIPSGGFGFANGGIAPGGFKAFANGGLVTGPTLGLVGEGRFNEAVVPLPNGKSIPVDLGNGTGNNISTNIVVNVNNGQASSQVNGSNGQAFGRELEGAVRSVILKESRPGGIIYNQR